MDIFDLVRREIGSDRSGRGVGRLLRAGHLQSALELLEGASSAALVTGFFVPAADAPETDGPGGAVALGRALERLGKDVLIYTDPLCLSAVAACSRSAGGPEVRPAETGAEVMEASPSLLVFIERLGRAADGGYYNMRSEDISGFTPPLDEAACAATAAGVPVVAVGDGGNEAGMGNFHAELSLALPDYAGCLSVVSSTAAVPADVSDWGGYALAALLSISAERWVGAVKEDVDAMLAALVGAGAVDGVTRLGEPTVDGFGAHVHRDVVVSLRRIVEGAGPTD